ncbi:hypothetical protein BpHYR1_045196 [Brachionus plicatilis]|uniref:Uncharacterized protein n=1 Tax=Brachionus plicatilis TaxID=10195 RepID=A0A3M7R5X9_BRAPC|nr:hypothetical protein BpHYR1_045196 [Brachionus plicatilis]
MKPYANLMKFKNKITETQLVYRFLLPTGCFYFDLLILGNSLLNDYRVRILLLATFYPQAD